MRDTVMQAQPVLPDQIAPIQDVALRLARRLRNRSGLDLSLSQVSALTTLERGGPLRVGELARREHISNSSATRLVAKLQGRGYITRTIDPEDRRSFLVAISDEGYGLLCAARDRANLFLAGEVDRLDAAARSALLDAVPALEQLVALPQPGCRPAPDDEDRATPDPQP